MKAYHKNIDKAVHQLRNQLSVYEKANYIILNI